MTKSKNRFNEPTVRSTPQQFAQKLRDRIKIDPIEANRFQFKISDRKEELECAFRLVHDNYIRNGYMTPQESGLRLSLRNALPETTTFIGKENQSVVSTMTVFQDSGLGLPMDVIYERETDALRAQGRKIAEVGSLANHPDIPRMNQTILMHCNKMTIRYCRDHLGVDDLVMAINPKHRGFYQHVLLCEQIGGLKAYNYVRNAPALAFRLNLRTLESRYRKVYKDMAIDKDIYRFFFIDTSPSIRLPKEKRTICFWNRDRIRYFFEEKTRLLAEASREALECLHFQYRSRMASAAGVFSLPLCQTMRDAHYPPADYDKLLTAA